LSNSSSAVSVEWPVRYPDWNGQTLTELNRYGRNCTSTSLFSTLEIVERFDIGLKFAGSPWSAPDFFSNSSTSVVLKHAGNFPSWNDRLANREIITANWLAHAFSKDVGTMSSGDDLASIFTSNLWTSAAVTRLKLSSDGPLCDLSVEAVVLYVKFTAILSSVSGHTNKRLGQRRVSLGLGLWFRVPVLWQLVSKKL